MKKKKSQTWWECCALWQKLVLQTNKQTATKTLNCTKSPWEKENPTDWTRPWVYLTISWRNTASALAPGFSWRALAATWLVSPLSSTTFSASSFFSNSLEFWESRGLSEVFFSSTWVPCSRGRSLLHSTVLTVSGPGLVFSRAAFLGTDAAMRIRVISWRRLHVKRGHSQHSHSLGLALLHKDGRDSPSSLLPSHSLLFPPINDLSSYPRVSACWKWEGPRRSSSPVVFNWEPFTPPLSRGHLAMSGDTSCCCNQVGEVATNI